MKTIFQINVNANLGSTGRIAEEIGRLAIANDWKSYIAFGRDGRPSRSKLIKISNKFTIGIHGLLTRFFDRHGFGSKCDTLKLIKQIKEINPDIIHLHVIHGYYINIKILFDYLAVANIPIVWTFHDCWAFTGHCTNLGCNRWVNGCYSCPQKKEYPSSFWLDNSKNNYRIKRTKFNSVRFTTIVTVSKWTYNQVKESFLKEHVLKTIYNGVDLDLFSPKTNCKEVRNKLGIIANFMIVGVSSGWGSRRFEDFIKLSKLIDNDIIIVLVGISEKQRKCLPLNIIGIARTEDASQLAEIYSAADFFLNLTYEDNFPTTNIESLACGTPILTYNTGGSIEAVSSPTGFIVEQGDILGVMDAIRNVKANGKSSYTKACRERAEKLYNQADRYNEYINLYESLIRK